MQRTLSAKGFGHFENHETNETHEIASRRKVFAMEFLAADGQPPTQKLWRAKQVKRGTCKDHRKANRYSTPV
jgi:hypothetical protein